MRGVKSAIFVAVVACFMGSSTAWATSAVQGSVVCAGTTTGVPDVLVTIGDSTLSYSASTDAAGAFGFAVTAGEAGFYPVTLDLTAAGGPADYSAGPVYVGFGLPYVLAPFEVDVPGCAPPPPPPDADCSPGYYKNHPEAWCGPCGFDAATCNALLVDLGTRGAGGEREAAKAVLDACFGTAEASPCQDDDL